VMVLWVLGFLWLGFLSVVWCMCVVAARADRQLEERAWLEAEFGEAGES